ncbi:MAG: hypothetical protein HKN09_09750 [Saprospiraceae bacterium]|nr:hypothetical protein [Saprospiraceae bacterium]
MKHNYTQNFLLKYLYKETKLFKTLEIENAIQEDKTVGRQYKQLLRGFRLLPKVKFYPSEKTMNAVLNYSNMTSLKPSF